MITDSFSPVIFKWSTIGAREDAEKALTQAGLMLLRDSIMEQPTVPLDEGTLRGSGSVFVEGVNTYTSQEYAEGGTPDPATMHGKEHGQDMIECVVGFNTPYAAHLHEHPEYNFQEESAGGKYLETPWLTNGKLYFQLVRDTLRRSLAARSRGGASA